MADDWRDRLSVPNAVLAGLVVAVAASLVVTASTSGVALSAYNSDWDGASELRSVASEAGAEVSVVRETDDYSAVPPDRTVAFVLSPESGYSPRDAARVNEFVRAGGTLVVADDFGPHSNALLRTLNASARIDGRLLMDARSNYRSEAMPVATNVSDHRLVADVSGLTLNHGTAVEPGGATPLVNTSEYAYADADGDGELGENESLGRYPVATVERVGEGRVVVVGDSSAFINAMMDRPGNRAFAAALASGNDRVLLDYSHAGGVPLGMLAVLAVRDSPLIQFGVGVLLVGALAVWSRRPGVFGGLVGRAVGVVSPPWRGGGSSREISIPDAEDRLSTDDDRFPAAEARASASELAAYLERRHPDWDRERVERVADALDRRRR